MKRKFRDGTLVAIPVPNANFSHDNEEEIAVYCRDREGKAHFLVIGKKESNSRVVLDMPNPRVFVLVEYCFYKASKDFWDKIGAEPIHPIDYDKMREEKKCHTIRSTAVRSVGRRSG